MNIALGAAAGASDRASVPGNVETAEQNDGTPDEASGVGHGSPEAEAARADRRRWPAGGAGSRRTRWARRTLIVAALVVAGIVVVASAGVRPAYDPYGWLVWGHQALAGTLDLGGAPSWKPLPFLFTLPYALFGHTALWLWMVTVVALALAGCIAAARIAHRLVAGIAAHAGVTGRLAWIAPAAAAVVAGLGVLEIQTYPHYFLSAQSDPVITSFCLIAIDCLLRGRNGPALAALVLAALGRPEAWPFLGLLGVWLWVRAPRLRVWVVAAAGLVVALWFGVPWLTNGRPGLSSRLAENTRQVLHHGQLSGTLDQFTPLHTLSIWIAAMVGVALAALRRRPAVLLLAGAVILWLVVEVVLAYDSLPVLPRFMFEAGAVAAVLAGVGVGAAAVELARLRARPAPLPVLGGVLAVGAAAALLVPAGLARVHDERSDLQQLHHRNRELAMLQSLIDDLGGARHLNHCGEPVTYVSDASAMAWLTGRNVSQIGYKIGRELRRRYPVIVFRAVHPYGWTVFPWHLRAADSASCSRMYVSDRGTVRPIAPSAAPVPASAPTRRRGRGTRRR